MMIRAWLIALLLVAPAMTAAAGTPGYRVCGKAGERPGPNPPLARFVWFTLQPGDVTVFSSPSGIFCFEQVPPGDYVISVRERLGAPTTCTLFGCWPDTPVHVVDADVTGIVIAMVADDCPCLTSFGRPGPGECPCDVGQCFADCVDQLCPGTPDCLLECARRCFCNDGPPECATHVDPGPTPTPIRSPIPTATVGAPCLGDGDGDRRVTIDELVGAVANALHGCP